jgi:hypothetical protein
MSSWASFAKRVDCCTVSNALLKSNAMTMTYGFVRSKLVIVLIMEMSAAIVEPVGRKANWSLEEVKRRLGKGSDEQQLLFAPWLE